MDELSLLLRLSLMWLTLGLLLGLLLRKQFQGRYISSVFMLTYLPWLAHLLYSVWLTDGLLLEEQLIYVLSSCLLMLATLWVGLRSIQRAGWSFLLLPVLHAFLYSMGPLWWFESLTVMSLIDSLAFLVFLGGVLFVVSILLGFRLPWWQVERRS